MAAVVAAAEALAAAAAFWMPELVLGLESGVCSASGEDLVVFPALLLLLFWLAADAEIALMAAIIMGEASTAESAAARVMAAAWLLAKAPFIKRGWLVNPAW